MSRIPFGQPVEPCASHDKWVLLDTLTRAANSFGLNHRTLTVLRALLTFYPERALPNVPGVAVVFPSNRTLSQRLNGMPESTLRRHLATLVRCGIVSRQDSANRKRFARFGGLAFGFDLSPLVRLADEVFKAASDEHLRQQEIDALRARIAATRMRLIEGDLLPVDHPLIEDSRRILRRKVDAETLRAVLEPLENHVDNARKIHAPAEEMSAIDSENERHIQSTNKAESVSKEPDTRNQEAVALDQVLGTCKEYKSFFPEAPKDWSGLIRVAQMLYPMMGIDRTTFEDARHRIGSHGASVAVLCILEKLSDIRKPGAYLRGLSKRAVQGQLNLRGMVKSLERPELSADNLV
ncbi:plasmid replication protein RepC [Antarctobacter heliothermus]|nr:plasmid replication protein RepC [Antarctobacter heliothermus]